MAEHYSTRQRPCLHGQEFDTSTTARRARKREQDRRSQRLARERTKNRIAHLESVIADLQQKNSNDKFMTLWMEHNRLAADRTALEETLNTIEKALQARKEVLKGSRGPVSGESGARHAYLPRLVEDRDQTLLLSEPIETNGPEVRGPHNQPGKAPSSTSELHGEPHLDCFSHISNSPSALQATSTALTTPSWESDPPSQHKDPIIPFMAGDICDCSSACVLSAPQAQPLNLWRFANETLSERVECSARIDHREDELEDDIPIRAVLEGWDAAQRRAGEDLPLSWRKLRRIDETLFSSCGKTERLAILRMMHSLHQFHQIQTPERQALVPKWYLARPSQSVAHSYAIDYFTWPGLRERFVFYQHKYCSNRFWSRFRSDFRILWPFEFRDCYTFNVATGDYKVSYAFDERIRDIRSWTMSSEMFLVWPEFLSDIPVYNSLLPSIVTRPSDQAVFPGHDWDSEVPGVIDSTTQSNETEAADFGLNQLDNLQDPSLMSLNYHLDHCLDESGFVPF